SLDRDYIVRSDHQYKLKLDGDAAWSEPLADMIGQTLAADLQQRLPGTAVYTATGAISAGAGAQLELDISQFADDGTGDAVVAGTLSIRPTGYHGPTLARPVHLSAPMSGKGVDALVAGLSQALGQLADLAAADARRLPPPAPHGDAGATPMPAAPVPLTAPPPVPFAAATSR
ncbi:MAG: membrane integrity-associated transporter subunit PqiC, partial [Gluconacetobacter diazotrophicus]|nr:membrane integrity-associated transporter subunit PqiC [Gluconacetobacter diazotrophicus]